MIGSDIYLKIKSFFEDKASAKIKHFTRDVQRSAKGISGSLSSLSFFTDKIPGQMGRAASSVGKLISAYQLMGPTVTAYMATYVALEFLTNKFWHSTGKFFSWGKKTRAIAESLAEQATQLKEKLAKAAEAVKADEIDRISTAVERATAETERLAKSFERTSAAINKTVNAATELANAQDDTELSKLELRRQIALGSADVDDRAAVNAEFDLAAARLKRENAAARGAATLQGAEQAVADAQKNLEFTEARIVALQREIEAARDDVEVYDDTDMTDLAKAARARLAKAEAALADAQEKDADASSALTAAQFKLKEVIERNEKTLIDADVAVKQAELKIKDLALDKARARQEEKDEAMRAEEERAARERIEAERAARDAVAKQLDLAKRAAEKMAEEWEERSRRAREGGREFGAWQRDERRRAHEQSRADAKQEHAAKKAADELARIEAIPAKAQSKWHAERAAQLREFIALQNPANNPGRKSLQEIANLQLELAKKEQADIQAINAKLANLGLK